MRLALRILRPHSLTLTLTLTLTVSLSLSSLSSLSHLSLISLSSLSHLSLISLSHLSLISLISPSSLSHLSLISLSSLSLSSLSLVFPSLFSLLSLLSQEDPGKEPHIKDSSPGIVCPAQLVQGVLPSATPCRPAATKAYLASRCICKSFTWYLKPHYTGTGKWCCSSLPSTFPFWSASFRPPLGLKFGVVWLRGLFGFLLLAKDSITSNTR